MSAATLIAAPPQARVMPYEGTPGLVGFDAGAACDAARGVAGDGLLTFVEFTSDEFNTRYVADDVLDLYRDEAHMAEHFERVLGHLHLDFMERNAYEDMLLPNAGSVTAMTTRMDEMTLLRVLSADDGCYVALSPAADVQAVIDAIEATID